MITQFKCHSCGRELAVDLCLSNQHTLVMSVRKCVPCKDACYNCGYQQGQSERIVRSDAEKVRRNLEKLDAELRQQVCDALKDTKLASRPVHPGWMEAEPYPNPQPDEPTKEFPEAITTQEKFDEAIGRRNVPYGHDGGTPLPSSDCQATS